MSIDHNRIMVADLEKGPEGTFLAPKSDGTLEFREIYTGLDCDIEGQVLDARQGKELKNYADAKVADAIVPGATDVAPSQNAVFDALDSKVDKGGGIANYVPKWNALLGLTNSQIFDNGTNVCIGITNPFDTYKTTTYQNSGGNIATFGYNGQTKIPKIGIQATADDEIGFNSDNSDHTVALTWIHNTNEVMRIAQNGSLLINTAIDNGVDKLQVNGSVNAKSFTAKQSGEANTVNLFKIIPSTIGNETYGLDFNSYPNSGGGAGTYNHGAWLGYNTGFHSLAPTTIGKPSIMIGLEDNYFDNSGDGLFGKEFYVQGFSPDGTTVQMSRPFYARGNQDNSGLDWWTIISNIGMNGNNRQFTVKAGNNALLNITPTRTTSYVELEANSLFSANSTILMNNEQYFQIKNSAGSGVSIMKVDSTNDMYFGDIFGGLRDIYFRNNGVSSVILKNNGNVLIGSSTDNGVNKLQVNGSGNFSSDSTVNNLTIGRGGGNIITSVALGFVAGANTTSASSNNTSVGYVALGNNTTGGYNVALGASAGRYIADGSTSNLISNSSVFVGSLTKPLASNGTNETVIGYNATGLGSNSIVLGSDSVTKTALKGNILIGTLTDNGSKVSIDKLGQNYGSTLPSGNLLLTNSNATTAAFELGVDNARGSYIQGRGINSTTTYNLSLNPSGSNVLVGTSTDNGVDKLQVNGSANIVSDSKINGLTIGIGNFNNASNTALGYRVLRSSIDGIYNTGVGENVLQASTHGSWTTAMGCEALFNHIAGNFVTGVGFQVLYNNTNGSGNTAFGHQSLYGNTNGSYNVAQGYLSGSYLLDGTTTNTSSNNSLFIGTNTKSFASAQTNEIVIGYNANGIGSNSVVLGNDSVIKTALKGNVLVGSTTDNGVDKLQVSGSIKVTLDSTINGLTIGRGPGNISSNTVLGASSLGSSNTGIANTSIGYQSLSNNTSGVNNTAIGRLSLNTNNIGSQNTAIGVDSLISNTSGSGNFAGGYDSLVSNTTGSFNIGIGYSSLSGNLSGIYNVALGGNAGRFITGGSTPNTSGSYSIFIGRSTNAQADGQSNQIVIGDVATGNGSNTVTIGNTSITDNYFSGYINVPSGKGYKVVGGTGLNVLKDDGTTVAVSSLGGGTSGSWIPTISCSYGTFSVGTSYYTIVNKMMVMNINFTVVPTSANSGASGTITIPPGITMNEATGTLVGSGAFGTGTNTNVGSIHGLVNSGKVLIDLLLGGNSMNTTFPHYCALTIIVPIL